MSAGIHIGFVQIGSTANNTGLFSGQNMQNNWDSHAPSMGARAGVFGNRNVAITGVSNFRVETVIGQPVADQDDKSNFSPGWISL